MGIFTRLSSDGHLFSLFVHPALWGNLGMGLSAPIVNSAISMLGEMDQEENNY